MNVTDALEIVLEHCELSIDHGNPAGRKKLDQAMTRLRRKVAPLIRKRALRTGSFHRDSTAPSENAA